MTYQDFLRSLHVTHAPYWVASVVVIALVRGVRRVLESIAAALRARLPPEP